MPKKGSNAEWSLSGAHRSVHLSNPKTDSTLNSVSNPNQKSTSDQIADWQVSYTGSVEEAPVSLDSLDSQTDDPPVVIIQSPAPDENNADPPDLKQGADHLGYPNEDDCHQGVNLSNPSANSPSSRDADFANTLFADQPDDVVLGQLIDRSHVVTPGEAITIDVGLINNDTQISVFSPEVIGALPQQWINITPSHTRLHPGEQTSFEITIKVPRQSTLKSGGYPMAVIIRSNGSGGRFCQMAMDLWLNPFTQLQMGPLQPKALKVGWRRPIESTLLPITNQGNVATDVMLAGQDNRGLFSFHFGLAPLENMARSRPSYSDRNNFSSGQGANSHFHHEQRQFMLLPGQTHYAPVTLRYRNPQVFHLKRQRAIFGITAYTRPAATTPLVSPSPPLSNNMNPQAAPDHGREYGEQRWVAKYQSVGQAVYSPLIGPGTLLSVAGTGLLGMLGIVVTLLLIILSLYPRSQPSPIVVTGAVQSPAQAALEIIVKVNETVPTAEELQQGNVANSSSGTIQEMSLASVAEAFPTAIIVQPFAAVSNPPADSSEQFIGQSGQAQLATPNSVNVTNVANVPVANDSATNSSANVNTEALSGIPVVQADMITSPGEEAATNEGNRTSSIMVVESDSVTSPDGTSSVEASSVEASRVDAENMTYEQMFRTVATHYELDWRMLAAQAYIESSFNPLAMGKRGDLGLMQILPTTWQEWAPRVNAQDPFDSYSNVLVAAHYTDYLRSILSAEGYPEDKWVLVAYNWGPNRVLDFIKAGGNWDALSDQRKKYAQDVIRIANSLPQN